jgi:type I restriction enzyme M protein
VPSGIIYAQDVKGEVALSEKRPAREESWTDKRRLRHVRTTMHITLKGSPLAGAHFGEFIKCLNPGNCHERRETWSENNPDGRWRCFECDELIRRDELNLDIFWIRDESLEESENLPDPDVYVGGSIVSSA